MMNQLKKMIKNMTTIQKTRIDQNPIEINTTINMIINIAVPTERTTDEQTEVDVVIITVKAIKNIIAHPTIKNIKVEIIIITTATEEEINMNNKEKIEIIMIKRIWKKIKGMINNSNTVIIIMQNHRLFNHKVINHFLE